MVIFGVGDDFYPIHSSNFSGGELHVQAPALQSLRVTSRSTEAVRVMARLQNTRDVMELILATELLKRELKSPSFELTIPYFPHARQDRVTEPFTAFTLKTMAKLINDLEYDVVRVYDPHSDVTPALLNNCVALEQRLLISVMYKILDNFIVQTGPVIVAPDAGAAKKAMAVAKHYKLPFIAAEKRREVSTGNITGTKIDVPQSMQSFLICDDICDGGRTFTELAKVLRNGRTNVHISLYVTHGIFSKGYAVFDGLIDKIFTTDTFLPEIPQHEYLAEVFVGKVTPSAMWVRQ